MQKFTGVVMQKESPRNHRSHDNQGPKGRPENGVNVVRFVFVTVWGFNKLKNCIDPKNCSLYLTIHIMKLGPLAIDRVH